MCARLDQVGLAVDHLEAVVHLRHRLERLDQREADDVGERDLAAARAGQVVVDDDAVVDQQLDRDGADARRGRDGQAGVHVGDRAGRRRRARTTWSGCGRRRRRRRSWAVLGDRLGRPARGGRRLSGGAAVPRRSRSAAPPTRQPNPWWRRGRGSAASPSESVRGPGGARSGWRRLRGGRAGAGALSRRLRWCGGAALWRGPCLRRWRRRGGAAFGRRPRRASAAVVVSCRSLNGSRQASSTEKGLHDSGRTSRRPAIRWDRSPCLWSTWSCLAGFSSTGRFRLFRFTTVGWVLLPGYPSAKRSRRMVGHPRVWWRTHPRFTGFRTAWPVQVRHHRSTWHPRHRCVSRCTTRLSSS